MPLVMSRGGKETTFRRSVRDSRGKIIRTLEFPNEQPVNVSWDDLPFIENDLHKALVPVRVTERGKSVVISAEEYAAIMAANTADDEPDDDELEKLTAPEPIAVDVSELPLSPQMAEAIKPPEPGVSSGAQPTRRPRK